MINNEISNYGKIVICFYNDHRLIKKIYYNKRI